MRENIYTPREDRAASGNLVQRYRRQKWQISHLWLFPVVFVYCEVLLRLFNGVGLFSHLIFPLLYGVVAGLFCLCLTSLFKRKANRVISIILLLLVGLVFTVECLVRRTYTVYMTVSAILTGTGGVVDGYSSDLFIAIFQGLPVIFMFFLPALLYIFLGKRRMPARRCKKGFVGLVLAFALVLMGVTTLFAATGESGETYKSRYEFNSATEYFGLMTSLRLDAKYAVFGNKAASGFVLLDDPASTDKTGATEDSSVESTEAPPAETTAPVTYNEMDLDFEALSAKANDEQTSLLQYVQSLKPSNQNEYTGLFKGKNLILICAEAYSDVVVDEKLTPTLYRLTHNGIYFSDYYQPTWGGSTSTGEYSFLLGLVPLDGVDTMLETQNHNLYFTLGNQLQRQNYNSVCFHNGSHTFYSRNLTHTNLGYSQFLAYGNGLEDITGAWVDDQVTFDLTMDTYIDQQPFSVYYMTASGHCPYTADKNLTSRYLEQVKAVYGDMYKDTTLYYICYQMALEDALTTMIEKLEAKGIADDTVICITTDHYPYGLAKSYGNNSQDYVEDLYGHEINEPWERDHNGLILWSGCLETTEKSKACEISTPTYSLDIVPTLSNLFGLEYDSRLLVGRDVFSEEEPLVLWNNYSWMTTEGKYNSSTGVFTPSATCTMTEDEVNAYVERMKTIVSNKISFSRNVLDEDFYGFLFNAS